VSPEIEGTGRPNLSPETQVMVITGTRKGIGKFLAQRYLEAGYQVVGCSREPPDWQRDGYAHFCLDVADEPAVRNLFARVRNDFGRLDVLVNNAGAASMNLALLTPLATVERLIQTNFVGTFLFSREAAKLMMRSSSGRIVNVASVAVPLKLEGESVYAASKAAVISLTEVLARELADYGITVNAVGPGPIQTDLLRGVSCDRLEALLDRLAIHRFCEMADVGNVVDFFLRRESHAITGQTLFVGGA
jgi:3-oxoacyl-[acyl-carrier protein] reductase